MSDRHELACAEVVRSSKTVRRKFGRWQTYSQGRWRDVDPRPVESAEQFRARMGWLPEGEDDHAEAF